MLDMARTKPTLKDVAKLAGCSTAVVSTVINNAKGNTLASEEMQKRVRAAASKLGYRPNFASRSLVRRSAETIGVYVPPAPWAGIGMRYEGAVVEGIEQACRAHGYDLLAINLGGAGTPDSCIHKFAEQRIDGLILLHTGHESEWVEPLLHHSPNVVAVNYYGSAPVDRVNFDDRAATAMAVRHLAELGHRRIAYVGSNHIPLGPGNDLRRAGYETAMQELGFPVHPQWVWDRGNAQLQLSPQAQALKDDGTAGAIHLWQLGEDRPTAVVCYGDLMAIHAMRQWQQLGGRLPRDMAVIGIDGLDIGKLITPELTSVLQPFGAMGRRAADLIVERARHMSARSRGPSARRIVDHQPIHELFAPDLLVRQSAVSPTHG